MMVWFEAREPQPAYQLSGASPQGGPTGFSSNRVGPGAFLVWTVFVFRGPQRLLNVRIKRKDLFPRKSMGWGGGNRSIRKRRIPPASRKPRRMRRRRMDTTMGRSCRGNDGT